MSKCAIVHAVMMPRLELRRFVAEPLGDGLYRLRAVVADSGYLPTYGSKRAQEVRAVRPIEVTLELPEGAELVTGEARQEIGQLEGRASKGGLWGGDHPTDNSRKIEWSVRAPAPRGPSWPWSDRPRAEPVSSSYVRRRMRHEQTTKSRRIAMFGFGKDKKKEEEEKAEKAEQEKVAQAMRSMSDQLAAKGKEVAELQKQLEAAKKEASAGDAAEKALAEAQAKMRQMQAEMAKLQIQAQSAQNKAKQAAAQAAAQAAEATKVEAQPAPGAVLGAASAAAPGMLAVGVSAWVRNAGGKNLRLRDKPGLQSNAFAGLPPGTQMTLLEGPVHDDGYPWWRVRVSDGREGWVAGTELVTSPE